MHIWSESSSEKNYKFSKICYNSKDIETEFFLRGRFLLARPVVLY